MGLDEFISGEVKEKDDDEEDNDQTQNLSSRIQSTSTTQDTSVGRCPSCGEKGEETDHWYYRCNTPRDECSIITFIRPHEDKD
jgi:hypothetical protein